MLRSLTVLRYLIQALLLFTHCTVMADSIDVLSTSQQALQQAMEYVPESVSFSEDTTNKALQKSKQALSELDSKKPVLPAVPRLDLLKLPDQPAIDIGDLAVQGQSLMGRIDDQSSRYDTRVLVFVSSSMPQQTIKRYLQQTRRIGAAMVLRGFINDSLQQTQQYLAHLLDDKQGEQNPTLLIDPTLFSRFDIQQVPTIVITESEIKPCLPTACPTPDHHRVGGDVALAWALALVSRQVDSDPLKATLRPLIKKLERL